MTNSRIEATASRIASVIVMRGSMTEAATAALDAADAVTRCEWCHGRSRKGDRVNHSQQWDNERGPWWKGERGLFHSDCSSISSAHHQCVCDLDKGGPWESVLSGDPYGSCLTCGKYRGWQGEDRRDSPRDDANRVLQTIPVGGRDEAKMATIRKMYRDYRHEGDA